MPEYTPSLDTRTEYTVDSISLVSWCNCEKSCIYEEVWVTRLQGFGCETRDETKTWYSDLRAPRITDQQEYISQRGASDDWIIDLQDIPT